MLNVGIIGTGFGAKVHVPGFKKIKNIKVTGIWGKNLSETKRLQDKFNIPNVFENWRDLVKSPKIDIISIATPPFLHKNIILAATKNKKSIICEKPFTLNMTQADTALKAARKAGIIHAVDFEFRYVSHFQELKKLIHNGKIGTIRYCKISWITGGRAKENFPLNWMNYQKLGGGVLLNYGSHIIDYLVWLFGDIKSVSGNLKILKKKNADGKTPDAEDYCEFMSIFKSGIPAEITISNVLFGGEGHNIEIYGSKGTLKLVNNNLFDAVKGFRLIFINENNISKTLIDEFQSKNTDGRIDAFSKLADDFIRYIKKQKSEVPTFIDGLRVHKVMRAIQKSQKLKKWVAI